ncbi:MAG: hypothetical protein Q8N89_12735 [Azonexus sp.]|nr:hypothetical protein [Azonexus sp.]
MASTRHPHQPDRESKERLVLYLLSAGALLLTITTVALGIPDLIELIHLLTSPPHGPARP